MSLSKILGAHRAKLCTSRGKLWYKRNRSWKMYFEILFCFISKFLYVYVKDCWILYLTRMVTSIKQSSQIYYIYNNHETRNIWAHFQNYIIMMSIITAIKPTIKDLSSYFFINNDFKRPKLNVHCLLLSNEFKSALNLSNWKNDFAFIIEFHVVEMLRYLKCQWIGKDLSKEYLCLLEHFSLNSGI